MPFNFMILSIFGHSRIFYPPLGHGPLIEVDESDRQSFRKNTNMQNHRLEYNFRGFTDHGRAIINTDKCMF